MKYLKYFESIKIENDNICYLYDGNYWFVKTDDLFFKRQLDVVKCPKSDIKKLLLELHNIMADGCVSDEIYLIYGYKNIYKNIPFWDIQRNYNETYNLDEFEYCGKVFLTKQQYKDIEIEKKSKKYNII